MEELSKLTGVKKAFLGFQSKFKEADVVVLPVPYDSTATYGVGSRFGPSAIIEASTQLELYDIELGKNIDDELCIHTLEELLVDKGSPAITVDLVKKAVEEILKHEKKPVVFGGEHSITSGVVEALEDVSVLQIDAHSDLRNSYEGTKNVSVLQIHAHADLRDSYEGAKYSHACAMRRVRDITKNTVSVGIRSMCDEEAEYIKNEDMEDSIFYADDLNKNRTNGKISEEDIDEIVSQLKENVYVTVDVDAFDPSLVPGTGTPQPGGLGWYDVLAIMKSVSEKKKVAGFDIVEVLPMPPLRTSEFIAAKLAYKMMGYFWL
jgi:agmatinase